MGMAASQARFLQLTARKTNLEYMGQQINQERLALANQSAGLFERQLTLEPPVPPSSLNDEYYTPGYSFTDSLDDVSKKIVSAPIANAYTTESLNIEVTDTSGGGTSTIPIDFDTLIDDDIDNSATPDTNNGIYVDNELYQFMTATNMQINGNTETIVLRDVVVEHSIYNPDGSSQVVQQTVPAILQYDNLQRLTGFTILEDGSQIDLSDDFSGASATLANISTATNRASGSLTTGTVDFNNNREFGGNDLTYSPVFDEDAFNDDMNEYEYKKATYDYEIERINLETAQIQEQDRSLELKMKQIDTEHKAISTEIDAVQKVIQKSIESSFKTFS